MTSFCLFQVDDRTLTREMGEGFRREDEATAWTLARIAEWDRRKLYLPAGYSSTLQYCVGHLGRTESSALKHIRAARLARDYPAIFTHMAAGRLSLGAMLVLGSHLTDQTADELLAAAAGRSRVEVVRMLAGKRPRLAVCTPAAVEVPSSPDGDGPGASWHDQSRTSDGPGRALRARRRAESQPAAPRACVAPLAPQRFACR